jgi:fatty acid synthase, animal type
MPDVLISGVAGRFPDSSCVDSFWGGLLSGKDGVTSDDKRWPRGKYEGVPDRKGTVPDDCIAAFDASYFRLSRLQADAMDPQQRMLLEVTREAITDAALRPEDLQSKRVGVFIAVSRSDAEALNTDEQSTVSGYAISGCATSMLANRISYAFNFKGPSRVVNAECASSAVAVHEARMSLLSGECDAAIVGGSNLLLRPGISQSFAKLNMLATDGKCRAFDESGRGYVRSEAVAACLLTLEDGLLDPARRPAYAKILGSGAVHGGYQKEGILYPNQDAQERLLRQVYAEAQVSPSDIRYIEAHGTGKGVFRLCIGGEERGGDSGGSGW